MKHFCSTLLFLLSAQLASTQNTVDTIKHYEVFKILNISYNGPIGNTIGLEYGQLKHCVDCQNTHRKYFGFGLELGLDQESKFIAGPKLTYFRGEGFMAMKGTLMLFSRFDSVSPILENPSFLFRPEFLLFPGRKRKFALSLSYNFYKALELDKSFYAPFGVISFNLAYQIYLQQVQ